MEMLCARNDKGVFHERARVFRLALVYFWIHEILIFHFERAGGAGRLGDERKKRRWLEKLIYGYKLTLSLPRSMCGVGDMKNFHKEKQAAAHM